MFNIGFETIKWNFDFCTDSIARQVEEITDGEYTIDNADYIEKLRLYTYKLWKANVITVKQFIEICTRIHIKIKLKKVINEDENLPF